MISDFIVMALIVAGMLAIGGALVLNGRLVATLPAGSLRRHWRVLMALEAAFIAGYAAYLLTPAAFQGATGKVIVPAIFFFGGVFVWTIARLSLQTAASVRAVAALEVEAVTDPLTTLYNRRYLDRRLAEEVSLAQWRGTSLSVLMVDLDHFKSVNDRFGHQVGDVVLVKLATLLRGIVRATDFVARYGGEEFVVVAPGAGPAEASILAERIRCAVASHDFALPTPISSPGPTSISASIGVASYGQASSAADELLRAGDRALYQAKRLGRNRVAEAGSEGPTEPARTANGLSAA